MLNPSRTAIAQQQPQQQQAHALNGTTFHIDIDMTFSLDEAAKALDYQKDAHPRGKIVLTV